MKRAIVNPIPAPAGNAAARASIYGRASGRPTLGRGRMIA
jgi:hypothetical protein